MGSTTPKMASKTARVALNGLQDDTICPPRRPEKPKMAPRRPRIAPRRSQMAPGGHQEAPGSSKRPPRGLLPLPLPLLILPLSPPPIVPRNVSRTDEGIHSPTAWPSSAPTFGHIGVSRRQGTAVVRRTRRRQNCTNANHRCACSLLDVCADPAAPRHPPPGHGSAGCVHHVIELVISQRHSPPESPPCRTASWARSRGRSWRRRHPPPCLGTLGRGRMPRAVCQGSCSLLRDPASGKQTVKRTTPTPGGVWAAMAPP